MEIWKIVENFFISGIIKTVSAKEKTMMTEIQSLGRINTQVIEKEFGKIQTDEIIITNE